MYYIISNEIRLFNNFIEENCYNKITSQYENVINYDKDKDYPKSIKEVIRFDINRDPYLSKPFTDTYCIIMDEFKRD